MISERKKRFLGRTTWVAVGGAAALAVATAVVVTRADATARAVSLAGGPITEVGGGGATPPMRSLNDIWGLSSTRATCTMCHNVRPSTMNIVDAVYAQQPVHFNRFGALYRHVLGFTGILPMDDGVLRPKSDPAGLRLLRTSDSDADGFSNEVELMFGSRPGRRSSHPWRPAAQLERWRGIIVRELRGRHIPQLARDPRVRRVGPDTDGDRVPDVLENFIGSNPRSRTSTPLVSARRVAVYRQLLLDAGVLIR